MKYIVEYKLHNGSIPYFIDDGGYYPIDKKMVGVTKDSDDCFIPKFVSEGGELVQVSNQDFINRVVGMDLEDADGNVMDADKKTTVANEWLSEKGFN